MENQDITTDDLLTPPAPSAPSAYQGPPKGSFEKQKKGIKMINQFGETERKRRIVNFFDISDMCLPPVTRNTVATYRIIGFDEMDRSSKQPREPQDVSIPGSYIFHDRGETELTRKNKLVMNRGRPDVRKDKISGKEVMDDDIIQEIMFIRSHFRANPLTEYPKYAFMELHPLNKTNPFRPLELTPIFERIDLYAMSSKSMAFQLAAQDLAFDAEKEVMGMEKDKVIGFATNAGIPITENGMPRPLTLIKSELRIFARNNPKMFFSLASDARPSVRLTILDAIHWGLIELNSDKKQFEVTVTGERLWTHGVQEDPIEGFISYLLSEKGQEQYNAINNMVNYWNPQK